MSNAESEVVKYGHDVAVLIGRFQPFHLGHAGLLAQALRTAPRVVIVLGSARQARTAKNPFTWQERAAMIRVTLDEAEQARVEFVPVRDYYDDQRWKTAVQQGVAALAAGQRIALLGYVKDASSYYLQRFPEWKFIAVERQGQIDATSIRQLYFEGEDAAVTQALLGELVPSAIGQYLKGWACLPQYAQLRAEHLGIEKSKKVWGSGPFITVDAVVRASGQILLVKRGGELGKGLWALPGGFLEPREQVLQGAIRELREETGLGLLDTSLEGALRAVAVFDHPDRSQRGRTITHAHYFDLQQARPPQVEGADDAAEACWVAISELGDMEELFFEDHFHILNHFLGLTG